VTEETAFFSKNFFGDFDTFSAAGLVAPREVAALSHRAKIVAIRPAVFTGNFFSLYADPVTQNGEIVNRADSSMPLFTEMISTARLFKATRVNGHWSTEPVEAKKIKQGDYVVAIGATDFSMAPIALKVDIGGVIIRAVVAAVVLIRSRPTLRAPIVEVGYSSSAPIICDGFSVS
jgi:hypothetical protein